jgi:hypothetical protein
VPRIFDVFNQYTQPKTPEWVPHFTSVINWALRLGLGKLKQVKPMNKPWLAMMDHSIDIGTKKAFVVLRVSVDCLSQKANKAIQLKDCECIGLRIMETVNGESIESALTTIFKQAGHPKAIIKDCDSTLKKGVRLWSDNQSCSIPVIDDIGHVMASALKHQFQNSSGYKKFTTLVSKGANQLRQTDLAFLTPPKLRTKGRFQSVSQLGVWGDKMLSVFAVKGGAKKGSLLARLRCAFPGFNALKPFIARFATAASVTSQIMKMLKNNGLSQSTYNDCLTLLNQLPKRSKVKTRIQQWLHEHLAIQKTITKQPLLVSSDIIESLFGRFKHVIERSSHADMNRTALLIPALCGHLDESIMTTAFNHACHNDLKQWEEDNIAYTMRKKRQNFFHNIQKPVN